MLPSGVQTASAPRSTDFAARCPACTCPCPTLRRHPRGCRRMARGRRGSLLLRRRALSSPPSCRFIPAHLEPLDAPQLSRRRSMPTPAGRVPASGAVTLWRTGAGVPAALPPPHGDAGVIEGGAWEARSRQPAPATSRDGAGDTSASGLVPPTPSLPLREE